jgi:hypothetical protein
VLSIPKGIADRQCNNFVQYILGRDSGLKVSSIRNESSSSKQVVSVAYETWKVLGYGKAICQTIATLMSHQPGLAAAGNQSLVLRNRKGF